MINFFFSITIVLDLTTNLSYIYSNKESFFLTQYLELCYVDTLIIDFYKTNTFILEISKKNSRYLNTLLTEIKNRKNNLLTKTLKIKGIGFKLSSSLIGGYNTIVCTLGYTHSIFIILPINIEFKLDITKTFLELKSFNKITLGLISAILVSLKRINVYKETGLCYAYKEFIPKIIKTKKFSK